MNESCLNEQIGLDLQGCIGYALFEDKGAMAGTQKEAVCSLFYSFLRAQFE